MRVFIPSPLRSYTAGASQVEAEGATLGAVLEDLERQFPGIRFRMIDEQDRVRPHIKLFVGREFANDVRAETGSVDEVHVIAALSGG